MVKKIFFAALLSFLLIAPAVYSADFQNIDTGAVREKIDSQTYGLILDVRTPREYSGTLGHIKGSKLIPIQELEKKWEEIVAYKNKKVIVYCKSGGRSAKASAFLKEKGFEHIENMLGGMMEWNKRGYPVER